MMQTKTDKLDAIKTMAAAQQTRLLALCDDNSITKLHIIESHTRGWYINASSANYMHTWIIGPRAGLAKNNRSYIG